MIGILTVAPAQPINHSAMMGSLMPHPPDNASTPSGTGTTKKGKGRKQKTNPDGSPVLKRSKSTPAKSPKNKNPKGVVLAGPPGPDKSPAKTVSAEDLQKARKMLEMAQAKKGPIPAENPLSIPTPLATPPPGQQQQQPSTASQLMASSPLLSSALTSPTRTIASPVDRPMPAPCTTTPSGLMITPTTTVRPPMPAQLSSVPQMPQNLATMLTQTPASHQQLSNLTPRLPQSTHVRTVMHPTVKPPASPLAQPATITGSPAVVSRSSPNMVVLPSNTSINKTITSSKQGPTAATSSPTVTAPGPRLQVVPTSTVHSTVPHQIQLKTTSASGGQENLYIVALPSDKLKGLDSSNLVQYSGSQMVTLVSDQTGAKGKDSSSVPPQALQGLDLASLQAKGNQKYY